MRIDRRAARREIVEDDAANEFTRFWGEIAVALKFLDLDIRTGKFEGDGKTYMAVVNLGTTEVAKLATRMTPAEIALFRVAALEILRDDSSAERGIDFMSALNSTELQLTQQTPSTQDAATQMTQLEKQTQTVQKMSKVVKDAALNDLVAERWLERVDDGRRLTLGPRSFLELREFILAQAPERARARWDKLL
jgi:hypothetical protein